MASGLASASARATPSASIRPGGGHCSATQVTSGRRAESSLRKAETTDRPSSSAGATEAQHLAGSLAAASASIAACIVAEARSRNVYRLPARPDEGVGRGLAGEVEDAPALGDVAERQPHLGQRAACQQGDVVARDQGFGRRGGAPGLAGIVLRQDGEQPAVDAAREVDLVHGHLPALAVGLGQGGEGRVRADLADADLGLSGGGRGREERQRRQGGGHRAEQHRAGAGRGRRARWRRPRPRHQPTCRARKASVRSSASAALGLS